MKDFTDSQRYENYIQMFQEVNDVDTTTTDNQFKLIEA